MKMYFRITSFLIAFILIALVSCERHDRPIAAKKGRVKLEIPYRGEEQPIAVVHAAPQAVGIKEVLPVAEGDKAPLDGKALYATSCLACHQATGLGIPGAFPPLAGSPYVTSEKTDRLASIMIYGLTGPIKVLGTEYNSMMAGLGPILSNEELAAIATYVRSSFGNNAPAVSAEVFDQVRSKNGSRGPFAISDLGEES